MNMPITVWRALSTASSLLSTTTTGIPACAKAIAIPLPIVPAPTTPAFVIGNGSAGGRPGIFASSRSAKKTWRSASEGFDRTSSSKSRVSRAMPKLNGSSTAACDRVDELVRGEAAALFGWDHLMRLGDDERRRLHRQILGNDRLTLGNASLGTLRQRNRTFDDVVRHDLVDDAELERTLG